MNGPACAEFLQRCLPRLRLRWAGFRKVQGQVCKRLKSRMKELGLTGFPDYRCYLEAHPEEWRTLDTICLVTISRFYRDREVFDALRAVVLPLLGKGVMSDGGAEVRCWSAGCCSGEEAYALQMLWKVHVVPMLGHDLPLRIIATDINGEVLERAREGSYPESSLRDLPKGLIQEAFTQSGRFFTVKESFRENIEFALQDIRSELPAGRFHLILCRNLVLTYFEERLQRDILLRIAERLYRKGILVTGIHESLPCEMTGIVPSGDARGIYMKALR